MRVLFPLLLLVVGCGGEEGRRDAGSQSDAGDAGEPDARSDGGRLLETGAPCTEADECVSGVCLPDSLGGTCTEPCEHDSDCDDLDAVCLVFPDDDGFVLGCGPPVDDAAGVGALCEEDGDCRNRRCECNVCGVPCVDGTDCVPGMVCTDVEVGFVAGTYL